MDFAGLVEPSDGLTDCSDCPLEGLTETAGVAFWIMAAIFGIWTLIKDD